MKGDPIHYRKGYKYILSRDWTNDLNLFVPFPGLEQDIVTDFIILTKNGLMHFTARYAWDGCSGPTWDDKTNMRGGLTHDGGYQLIRLGLLSPEWKGYFDDVLREMCASDGMCKLRALYYHEGVEHFSGDAAQPGSEPYPELTAP